MALKIRYREIHKNKFEIILPDINEDPIGAICLDPYEKKSGWRIDPYFTIFYRDESAKKKKYDDFTKAGRALVDLWSYTKYLVSHDEDYELDDIFKNLGP